MVADLPNGTRGDGPVPRVPSWGAVMRSGEEKEWAAPPCRAADGAVVRRPRCGSPCDGPVVAAAPGFLTSRGAALAEAGATHSERFPNV
ncbi:hypothetical protein GCM10010329_05430 [Streptomyces spiroverticillatus]|uniref:Uncharacterized protein n=1 Tax=Streptomyces finlayi TaxID=67296 RepID=A0A918WSQ2_9ACTN|nr:hypothetical protein GCM10010329_05430 [Streptomyces spiroverticillatus]GHC79290.1 hypothetical protein GCM10010334_05410 [Streptomyces finlayi]